MWGRGKPSNRANPTSDRSIETEARWRGTAPEREGRGRRSVLLVRVARSVGVETSRPPSAHFLSLTEIGEEAERAWNETHTHSRYAHASIPNIIDATLNPRSTLPIPRIRRQRPLPRPTDRSNKEADRRLRITPHRWGPQAAASPSGGGAAGAARPKAPAAAPAAVVVARTTAAPPAGLRRSGGACLKQMGRSDSSRGIRWVGGSRGG